MIGEVRWIYPSQGPNGEFGETYRRYGTGDPHLAKQRECVRHVPSGKEVWISAQAAEWLRSGDWPPAGVVVCDGTGYPEYIVHSNELEL